MARILLVHGAAHGAWCWDRLLPHLGALGHDAVAIDLPGHGADTTPPNAVTLDRYADAILDALDTPRIVVGHSMAGFPISLAAERAPERLQALVYLCAYVPVRDHSLAQMRMLWPEQPLVEAIRHNPDGISMHFDPALAPSKLYQDCPPDAVADALPRLCDQPLAPMRQAVDLGAAYASVPRHYIRCTADAAIPPGLQALMAQDFPPGHLHRMDTGHSPFYADPPGLAQLLDRIAG